MAAVPVGHLTRVRAEIWSEIGSDGAALRADEQPLYVNDRRIVWPSISIDFGAMPTSRRVGAIDQEIAAAERAHVLQCDLHTGAIGETKMRPITWPSWTSRI
jgi:hypothetical protein